MNIKKEIRNLTALLARQLANGLIKNQIEEDFLYELIDTSHKIDSVLDVDLRLLKTDITKLQTVASYARKVGQSVPWIYRLGRAHKINIIEIDGVKFVKVD